MYGYIILGALAVVFMFLGYFISKRFPLQDIDDFVTAGHSLPMGLTSASVMVAWIWTTTLVGTSETGFLFGISGGIAYATGAFIPFLIFIPVIIRIRKLFPEATTFTEVMKIRYGKTVQKIMLIFAVGLCLYIMVEQMVGIGYTMNQLFDIPYAVVVIIVTLIITLYITKVGLRGSVINDLIQFTIICIVIFGLLPVVLSKFGIDTLYEGLQRVAQDTSDPNHMEGTLSLVTPSSFEYFIITIVISFGYVFLDQGYYSKALATINNKTMMRAYLFGTIFAWGPIPILCAIVLGCTGLALGLVPGGGEISVSSDVGSFVFGTYIPVIGPILFSLVVFFAGMTTAGNAIVGLQALIFGDLQEDIMHESGESVEERAKKGRFIIYGFGLIVIIAAILLNGVSLVYIDIMSGIVFAAPMAALLIGLWWSKPNEALTLWSIILGVVGGIATYLLTMKGDPVNASFYGNLVSLFLPLVVLLAGGVMIKDRFKFNITDQ